MKAASLETRQPSTNTTISYSQTIRLGTVVSKGWEGGWKVHFVKMLGKSSVYFLSLRNTVWDDIISWNLGEISSSWNTKTFFFLRSTKGTRVMFTHRLSYICLPPKPSESIGIFQVIKDDAFILPEKDHQTHGFLPTLAGLGLSLKHLGSLYTLPIFGGIKLDANLW